MFNKYLDKLKAGKQLGKTIAYTSTGKELWCSAAIQKHKEVYKIYLCEIFEDNIVAEIYERDLIRSFTDMYEALKFIKNNSAISVDTLRPLKGQKIFNPAHED